MSSTPTEGGPLEANLHARLEALKWLALATMLIDHLGKMVFVSWMWEAHAVGRLSWPLFSVIAALRLAASPEGLAVRYRWRLLPWAILAQPAFRVVSDGEQLNILWTLLAGVLLASSARRASWPLALLALALSPFCEFGPVGVLSIPLMAKVAQRRGATAAAWLCGPLAVLAHLPLPLDLVPWTLPALLASPLAVWLRLPAPRIPRWVYYAVYPAHLYALWAWYRWWV